MKHCGKLVAGFAGWLCLFSPLQAQEATDNGTDPTKLRRTSWISYENLDLGHGASRGTLELMGETPISSSTSLRLTVPVVGMDAPGLDDDFALGDIALRATHLLSVTPARGLVLQGEIFADTAERRELGYGTTVLKGTLIYAKFLEGQRILAPAFSHAQSVGDENRISETTVDFYYVPKLANPALYMTVDPAVVRDWEKERLFGSLAVTLGSAVGRIGGGLAQAYVKPGLFVGSDRPGDWSIEVGFRVIGF